ncbi:MAG: methionine aminotransferase [Lentimicrobiaceae bacterium]|nr:methionine aminotransferase [Lentimicrobiaceae bacterium]
MEKFPGSFASKQPGLSTSIFAVMSGLANECNAINLSQGFPDFPISEKLISLVEKYMRKGMNQYAPMQGVLSLREGIAEKVKSTCNVEYDSVKEINITAGGTQAISSIIAAFIHPDDEALIFEPAYDSYAPSVILNGGIVKYVELRQPDFHIDWKEIKKMISNRTRMIILNTPHNPSGSIWKPEDMKELEKITQNTDIIILSDEVYEHLIFDGIRHESVCLYPELAQRSLIVGSFGKTFHTTGWKVGFVLAPENLMSEFRKVHQFVVFCVNTPVQHAYAEFIRDKDNYESLSSFYQQKRDLFAKLIQESRFKVVPCYGTYFQLLDYSRISEEKEFDFAVRLTKEYGLGSVPVSAFYHKGNENKLLRFCFAKTDETLEKSAEILCKI